MNGKWKKRAPWIGGAALTLLLAGGYAYWALTPRVLFLGIPPQQLFLLSDASKETGVRFWFWMKEKMDDPHRESADFSRYRAIFVSGRRMEPIARPVEEALRAAAQRGAAVYFIPEDAENRFQLTHADPAHSRLVAEYWHHSGPRNIANFLRFVAREHLGRNVDYAAPEPTPDFGYYHPDTPDMPATTEEYLSWYARAGKLREGAPRVLIDFADGWRLGMTAGTDALIEAFEKRGANAAAVFGSAKTADFAREFRPDIVISRRHGRWADGPAGVEMLEKELDVPLLRGASLMFTGETFADYRQTKHGLRGVGLAMGAVVPELDGAIEPTLIEGMDAEWTGRRFEAVEQDRLDRLADRAMRWIELRRKPNAEKRVAVIYVAGIGKGRITAANLNVPRSLIGFLQGMREAGYDARNLPTDADALLEEMLAKGRNVGESQVGELEELAAGPDVTLIPAARYAEWFATLPEKLRAEVVEAFGPPPGRFMTVERDGQRWFVVPKLDYGNVVVLPQPARGPSMNAKLQHNDRIPPNHQYLAVYWWLQHEFRADALVNYGTHGTHEFLPGRPFGQLADDWSDVTLGRMPNLYVYTMDNVGEALIAKRRGSAVTVDHQVPPIGDAQLSQADPEIDELYRAAEQFGTVDEGALKERLRARIVEIAAARRLDADLGFDWSANPATDDEVDQLQEHIHLINEDKIPLGLHVHGRANPPAEAAPLVASIVGRDLTRAVAERDFGLREESGVAWEQAKVRTVSYVESALAGKPPAAAVAPHLDRIRTLGEALRATEREVPQTLHALAGGYIPPGSGGDPTRNPGALPTSRNLYGINPQEVPTKAAWEVGVALAEELLAAEQKRLGRFPRKVGFTLWNTELIRHYGTDLAQILYLLGVRPVWDHRGIVADIELIPAAELGRPRVDVVIQAASLFRDTFPDRMEFLDRAARLAIEAGDGENYAAQNAAEAQAALKELGLSPADARLYSAARIFSNNPGGYGTGVISGTERSGEFEDTKKITEEYLARTGAVYTEGAEWGVNIEGLYAQALAGTDAVALSRSTNVISPLTLDHYFEYLGGMTMAVRDTTGVSPETYVADVRDAERSRMETVKETLTRDLRGKYWNPRWIREQQEEGFSGAVEIAQTATNLFGWQVTKPEAVDEYVWDEVERVYVEDSLGLALPQWFDAENPYAYQGVTAVLLEAARKGYWNPDAEVLRKVATEYARSVAAHGPAGDSRTLDNAAFQRFLRDSLMAPGNIEGIELTSLYDAALAKSAGVAAGELVEGRRLVREDVRASGERGAVLRYSAGSLIALAIVGAAFLIGARRRRKS